MCPSCKQHRSRVWHTSPSRVPFLYIVLLSSCLLLSSNGLLVSAAKSSSHSSSSSSQDPPPIQVRSSPEAGTASIILNPSRIRSSLKSLVLDPFLTLASTAFNKDPSAQLSLTHTSPPNSGSDASSGAEGSATGTDYEYTDSASEAISKVVGSNDEETSEEAAEKAVANAAAQDPHVAKLLSQGSSPFYVLEPAPMPSILQPYPFAAGPQMHPAVPAGAQLVHPSSFQQMNPFAGSPYAGHHPFMHAFASPAAFSYPSGLPVAAAAASTPAAAVATARKSSTSATSGKKKVVKKKKPIVKSSTSSGRKSVSGSSRSITIAGAEGGGLALKFGSKAQVVFKRGKSGAPEISLGPVGGRSSSSSSSHKLTASASAPQSSKSYPPAGNNKPGISFSFGGGNGNKGKQVTKYGSSGHEEKKEEEDSMIGGLFPFGLQLPHISIGGNGDGSGPYISIGNRNSKTAAPSSYVSTSGSQSSSKYEAGTGYGETSGSSSYGTTGYKAKKYYKKPEPKPKVTIQLPEFPRTLAETKLRLPPVKVKINAAPLLKVTTNARDPLEAKEHVNETGTDDIFKTPEPFPLKFKNGTIIFPNGTTNMPGSGMEGMGMHGQYPYPPYPHGAVPVPPHHYTGYGQQPPPSNEQNPGHWSPVPNPYSHPPPAGHAPPHYPPAPPPNPGNNGYQHQSSYDYSQQHQQQNQYQYNHQYSQSSPYASASSSSGSRADEANAVAASAPVPVVAAPPPVQPQQPVVQETPAAAGQPQPAARRVRRGIWRSLRQGSSRRLLFDRLMASASAPPPHPGYGPQHPPVKYESVAHHASAINSQTGYESSYANGPRMPPFPKTFNPSAGSTFQAPPAGNPYVYQQPLPPTAVHPQQGQPQAPQYYPYHPPPHPSVGSFQPIAGSPSPGSYHAPTYGQQPATGYPPQGQQHHYAAHYPPRYYKTTTEKPDLEDGKEVVVYDSASEDTIRDRPQIILNVKPRIRFMDANNTRYVRPSPKDQPPFMDLKTMITFLNSSVDDYGRPTTKKPYYHPYYPGSGYGSGDVKKGDYGYPRSLDYNPNATTPAPTSSTTTTKKPKKDGEKEDDDDDGDDDNGDDGDKGDGEKDDGDDGGDGNNGDDDTFNNDTDNETNDNEDGDGDKSTTTTTTTTTEKPESDGDDEKLDGDDGDGDASSTTSTTTSSTTTTTESSIIGGGTDDSGEEGLNDYESPSSSSTTKKPDFLTDLDSDITDEINDELGNIEKERKKKMSGLGLEKEKKKKSPKDKKSSNVKEKKSAKLQTMSSSVKKGDDKNGSSAKSYSSLYLVNEEKKFNASKTTIFDDDKDSGTEADEDSKSDVESEVKAGELTRREREEKLLSLLSIMMDQLRKQNETTTPCPPTTTVTEKPLTGSQILKSPATQSQARDKNTRPNFYSRMKNVGKKTISLAPGYGSGRYGVKSPPIASTTVTTTSTTTPVPTTTEEISEPEAPEDEPIVTNEDEELSPSTTTTSAPTTTTSTTTTTTAAPDDEATDSGLEEDVALDAESNDDSDSSSTTSTTTSSTTTTTTTEAPATDGEEDPDAVSIDDSGEKEEEDEVIERRKKDSSSVLRLDRQSSGKEEEKTSSSLPSDQVPIIVVLVPPEDEAK